MIGGITEGLVMKQPFSDRLFSVVVLLPFGAAIAYLYYVKGAAFDSFIYGSGSWGFGCNSQACSLSRDRSQTPTRRGKHSGRFGTQPLWYPESRSLGLPWRSSRFRTSLIAVGSRRFRNRHRERSRPSLLPRLHKSPQGHCPREIG